MDLVKSKKKLGSWMKLVRESYAGVHIVSYVLVGFYSIEDVC